MDAAWDEQAVFLQALELPPERRAEFLRQACPDDARRERVEDLIRHYEVGEQERFLEAGLPQLDDSATESGHGWTKSDDATQTSKEYAPIDQFQRIIWLGGGGWGDVYLAEDTELRRRVAIKVLKPELTGSADALERFRNEARAAAALKHPGIVPVFTFGKSTEGHYIVSEFVDGPTLAKFIQRQRDERDTGGQTLSSRDYCRFVAEVIAGVADALEAAHRAKIIHRDVKPANIILEGGECPRLTDFGIAKQLDDRGSAADTRPLATPEYMSPEQASHAMARAVVIDHRSDVFSLGVVMYEMLALERPFRGKGMDMVRDVLEVEPIRLRRRDSRVPKDLETICHKCLEKEPQRRYQSAAHVAADLRAFLRNDPILAQPPGLVRRTYVWLRKRQKTVLGASLVVLIVFASAATWLSIFQYRRSMCTLEIDVLPATSRVTITRFDPNSLMPLTAEDFGVGSTRRVVAVGQYRVTAYAAQEWDERQVLLSKPGEVERIRLRPITRSVDCDDMVRIPGGLYSIGKAGHSGLSGPRTVRLKPFYIDRSEVSNAAYRVFADATGHEWPPHWVAQGYDDSLSDKPVVGITWQDANAYAAWCGKRLPRHDEWEAAMRAPDNRLVPWGNVQPSSLPRVSVEEVEIVNAGSLSEAYGVYGKYVVPVDSAPDLQSALGLYHGASNVSEYTETVVLGQTIRVVIKGASWVNSPTITDLANTRTQPFESLLENGSRSPTWSMKIGFRCARSDNP